MQLPWFYSGVFYDEILPTTCDLGLFQANSVLNSMGRVFDLVFLEDSSISSLFRIAPISIPEDKKLISVYFL